MIKKEINNNISQALTNILKLEGINVNGKWAPLTNIFENDKEIIIYMSIPMLNEKSLKLEFINNTVLVTGNNEIIADIDSFKILRQEFKYNDFERKIILPYHNIDKKNVSIKYDKGTVCINISKNNGVNMFSVHLN